MRIKKEWIGIGVVFVVMVVLFLLNGQKPEIPEDNIVTEEVVIEEVIKVYINGEVNAPGVYEMNTSDRLNILVELAGGLTDNAEIDGVNMAKILKDGEMVTISGKGEEVTYVGIDIFNYGDLEMILSVNGIGEVLAKRILSYRDEHGLFTDFEDLLEVEGIGEQKLKSIESGLMN
jgi:competence protein ComEA